MLATSILFLFFVILGGVTNHSPLKHTYFLQADTSGMTGARDVTQWTYFYACGPDNTDCGSAHPAMPFGKAWAPHATGVPDKLIGSYGGNTTSFYYYYMWRFSWVFYLIALFLEVCAFFSSFLACCGRLGAGISGLVTLLAFVFLSIAVSLMTYVIRCNPLDYFTFVLGIIGPIDSNTTSATFVKARGVFHTANRTASLGKYAFGFSWGALVALLIAVILLCAGTTRKSGKNNNPPTNGATPSSGRGWRRGRSRRNRAGSFSKVNYEDGRLDNVSV